MLPWWDLRTTLKENLTMVADTMIPEAYARAHLLTGLVVTAGFITAFTLTRA